ncbi:MAG: hypothetical protein JNJ47_02065 [Alphaproteobacteria bacterium]|nr:hypothetical protein [Alphaproteobacteria bacterium]
MVKERRAPGEHSKPGDAHLLLQARVKALNQELKLTFEKWSPKMQREKSSSRLHHHPVLNTLLVG